VLVQITAPHFCAGFIIEPRGDWYVTEAAPIIRYMVGWSTTRVSDYCRRKGWLVVRV
jgi:hypothetical protein